MKKIALVLLFTFVLLTVATLVFDFPLIKTSTPAQAQTCQDDDGVCPEGCAPESDDDCYQIGVYYFGKFSPEAVTAIERTEEFYGRENDWWGGVRDFHGDCNWDPAVKANTQEWCPSIDTQKECKPTPRTCDFSHLKPAMGYYNQLEPSTLERHIRQARSHGISFFNFYWYWKGGAEYLSGGLESFLAAENSSDLDFMLSLTAHGGSLTIPESEIPQVVNLIISKYFSKSNYLQTSNGRPIIHILDSRGIRNGDLDSVLDFSSLLKQETKKELGVTPFILINSELGSVARGAVSELAVDGYSCLALFGLSLQGVPSDRVGSYNYYVNHLPSYFAKFDEAPYMFCYMSDFNEQPRSNAFVPKNKIRYVDDWSFTLFGSGLEKLKNHMDSSDQGLLNHYLTLYAWNEWRESGYNLEPSGEHGDRMLDKVAEVFNLSVYGDNYCQTYGYCKGKPTGTLDRADCDYIAGWARDPNFMDPIDIRIYEGGSFGEGGDFITATTAELPREDLPFPDKNHGFRVETPSELKTGTPKQIYVHAISEGSGNPLLNGAPKIINCLLEGDLDGNGRVNNADLQILLSRFGTGEGEADLNGDGLVNGMDFGKLVRLAQ